MKFRLIFGVALIGLSADAFETDALKPFPVHHTIPANLSLESRKFDSAPSVTVTSGGRLWVAWHAGGETEGEDNAVLVATSGDGGRNWTRPLFAIDAPGPLRGLDPGLWTDPSGKVWLFYAQIYSFWDGRGGVWAMHPLDAEDESTEWTAPRRLCDGFLKNKPLVAKDGRWLYPVEFMNFGPTVGNLGSWRPMRGPEAHPMPEFMAGNCFVSADCGQTVSFLGRSQIPPPDRDCTENMIVERKDGTLWMLSRTKYGIGEAFSRDGGKCWTDTVPSKIQNPSSRFFIGRLKGGALLLVKNGSVGSRTGREEMMAFVSDDDGMTWKGGLMLDARKDVSYPDAAQGSDGFIHVVHDRERTKAREILHHCFTEADVRAAKLVTEGSRLGNIVTAAPFGRSKWIGSFYPESSPLLIKRFKLTGNVKRATLRSTGVGFHEVFLNGQKVGDRVLDPAPTAYDKRVLYAVQDVDITSFRTGENELGLLLGHGWYDVRSRDMWWMSRASWKGQPRGIVELEIEQADGVRQMVVSDESWRQGPSPVGYDCIYEGEVDGACDPIEPDYQREHVLAKVLPPPGGVLERQCSPPARIVEEFKPTRIVDTGEGRYAVAFPVNMTGRIRLHMQGQRSGDVVTVRYDERIGEDFDLPAKRWIDQYVYAFGSGRLPGGPGRFQTDRYVCKGGDETFEPHFSLHGFQYVQLTGLRQSPSSDDLRALVVSTDFKETGIFRCSDERFNRLMKMAARSYRSNFADGYPTDCPHREKLGWTGDAAIACTMAQYMFENTSGYDKWILDLVDSQNSIGEIPGVVPSGGWGYVRVNGPAWDCALMVVPWTLYCYRGDRRAVETAFPAVRRYMHMVAKRFPEGLVDWGLKDWHPIKTETPVPVTATAYTYRNAILAARMARTCGDESAARDFEAYANTVYEAFQRAFRKAPGVYSVGGQTVQAIALEFGLVPADERTAAQRRLVSAVHEANDHFDVGIQGMNHVFRALSKAGETGLAFKMLTQPTDPSPLSWIDKGATTLWDNWGDGDSRNHIMFGDFAAWAYQYLAGIRFNEEKPDPSHFILSPEVIPELDYVEASTETVCGRLFSSWKRENGRVVYEFDVPPGGRAEVLLAGKEMQLSDGRHRVEAESAR